MIVLAIAASLVLCHVATETAVVVQGHGVHGQDGMNCCFY